MVKNFGALAIALIIANWAIAAISGWDDRVAWLLVIIILLGAAIQHPDTWSKLSTLLGSK